MIYRSDDITVDSDVSRLRIISDIIGQEVLAVVYKGGLNGGDEPFNENTELMKFLRDKIDQGSEIALHGYYHRDISYMPTGDAIWELIRAKKEIESLLEVKIRYYVPFQHIITPELKEYLKVIDIEVLEGDGQDLVQLVNNNQLPNPDSKQVWYHWWEMDVNKLKEIIERGRNES